MCLEEENRKSHAEKSDDMENVEETLTTANPAPCASECSRRWCRRLLGCRRCLGRWWRGRWSWFRRRGNRSRLRHWWFRRRLQDGWVGRWFGNRRFMRFRRRGYGDWWFWRRLA